METTDLRKIVEVLLFVTDSPINEMIIRSVLGEEAQGQDIPRIIQEIADDYTARNSPLELRFVAGGWQFATRKEFSSWVRKLYKDKTTFRLSPSALETLSIVAYKQPITRSEIEEIRGVEVSGVMETLLERKLVRIVGRKETIGRPILYGTTQEFLRHFGLGHLSELPSLQELTPPEEAAAESPEEATPELPLEETSPDQTNAPAGSGLEEPAASGPSDEHHQE